VARREEALSGRLARLLGVERADAERVGFGAAAGFCVLGAWFVVRPVRDAMGTLGRAGELERLMFVTPAAMLAVTPALFFASSRLPRDRFVALAFRFFALSLLAFGPALAGPARAVSPWAARSFFVWASVLNFFALSLFWGTMADRFTHRQGVRSFGVIGAGGTLGALAGSLVTAGTVEHFGPLPLLALSAALFELGLRLVRRVAPAAGPPGDERPAGAAGPEAGDAPGRARRGAFARVTASPYLLGIAGYVLCWAVTSTFVYLEQASLARAALPDANARAALFAKVEAAVQAASLVLQLFATGRLLRALGAGRSLALLPAFSLVGFAALGAAPRLALLVTFQVARRTLDFALAKPSRELLFTVVDRDDKYKTKSVIDTLVYRGGDVLGSVLVGGAAPALGARPAWLALPLCALWVALALYLGAASERRAASRGAATP
jgi:AAA family ATP:ADP antiporter